MKWSDFVNVCNNCSKVKTVKSYVNSLINICICLRSIQQIWENVGYIIPVGTNLNILESFLYIIKLVFEKRNKTCSSSQSENFLMSICGYKISSEYFSSSFSPDPINWVQNALKKSKNLWSSCFLITTKCSNHPLISGY